MDNRQTCNELFLRAVANEYAIDYKKLKMGVSDAFTREEQEDIDPDGDYLRSTQHFDRFVKEHEIKELNVGAVVLYLKGVKMAVSHQENLNLVDELEYEITSQNKENFIIGFVICVASSVILGLSFAMKK